jgi:V/A-type H+/Na+-transporting ATPase subunit F
VTDAKLVVVTSPELALGFQLAGIEACAVPDTERASAVVADLLDSLDVGLIAISQDLMAAMDEPLRRRLDASLRPVVVTIPGATGATGCQDHIADLIRHAVGFPIALAPSASEPS